MDEEFEYTDELRKDLQSYQDAIVAKVASKVVAGRWALEQENKKLKEKVIKKEKFLQLYGGSRTHGVLPTLNVVDEPTTFKASDIEKPPKIHWVVVKNHYTDKHEPKRLVNPTPSILAAYPQSWKWKHIADHHAEDMNKKEAVKTCPIGYDPTGEWTITMHINNHYKPILMSTANLDLVYYIRAKGLSFTTKEQAEKAAAGKNARKELVFALDGLEKSHIRIGYIEIQIVAKNGLNMSVSVPKIILDKLGEEKIKLALEWGS